MYIKVIIKNRRRNPSPFAINATVFVGSPLAKGVGAIYFLSYHQEIIIRVYLEVSEPK